MVPDGLAQEDRGETLRKLVEPRLSIPTFAGEGMAVIATFFVKYIFPPSWISRFVKKFEEVKISRNFCNLFAG
jgi:hypothetical protein